MNTLKGTRENVNIGEGCISVVFKSKMDLERKPHS